MFAEEIKKVVKSVRLDAEGAIRKFLKDLDYQNREPTATEIEDFKKEVVKLDLDGIETYITENDIFNKLPFMKDVYLSMLDYGVGNEMTIKLFNVIYSGKKRDVNVFEYFKKFFGEPSLKEAEGFLSDLGIEEYDQDFKDKLNELIKRYIDPKGSNLLREADEYKEYLRLKKKYEGE